MTVCNREQRTRSKENARNDLFVVVVVDGSKLPRDRSSTRSVSSEDGHDPRPPIKLFRALRFRGRRSIPLAVPFSGSQFRRRSTLSSWLKSFLLPSSSHRPSSADDIAEMAKKKGAFFYAVKNGRQKGVFLTW